MERTLNLHGSAPDHHEVALLLIDVINHFEFPSGPILLPNALSVAPNIVDLKARAWQEGIPAIYVNDNFGRWQSNFQELLTHCLDPGVPGEPFVKQLVPGKQDYFVLKPKHSGFYQTPLEILLKHLGAKRLILAGLCSNSCVLFTAQDAYMRDFELFVPSDCMAACSCHEQDYSVEQIKNVLKADVTPSREMDWPRLLSVPQSVS